MLFTTAFTPCTFFAAFPASGFLFLSRKSPPESDDAVLHVYAKRTAAWICFRERHRNVVVKDCRRSPAGFGQQ
jgi:hypothetical protein